MDALVCFSRDHWRPLGAVAFAGNALINYRPEFIPDDVAQRLGLGLGQRSNGLVSQKYPTLLTPSKWAFALWGPIFACEGIASLAPGWVAALPAAAGTMRAVAPYWQNTCLVQTVWTIVFSYGQSQPAAVALGVPLLVGVAYLTRTISTMTALAPLPLFVRLGFGIHAAWATVAAVLNVNAAVRALGAPPAARLAIALSSVAGLTGLSLHSALVRHNPMQALITAWACFGIVMNKETQDVSRHQVSAAWLSLVSGLAAASGLLCLGAGVFVVFSGPRG